MNSNERHKARYERRKTLRCARKLKRAIDNSDYEQVLGLASLLEAYTQVSKASKDYFNTQSWMSTLLVHTRQVERKLQDGSWESWGFNKFTIKERGKIRDISSVHIQEKGIQNALSNNYLIPILRPTLIYDNGASLSGKGTDFALDRLEKHLKDHYKKYGLNGYIYFFDFKSYFANVNLDKLVESVRRYVNDDKLFQLYKTLIYNYKDGGLGLGSQVSQISAVFYPNPIDHLIKDQLGVHGYGRYMDDGYIICDSLSKLKEIIAKFEKACEALDIVLNKKKCQIIPFHKQFKFLKTRFFVTPTGKVVRKIGRQGIAKERHRLRKFKKFYEMGLMSEQQIYLIFHSWLLSQRRGKNYHIQKNMIMYYNDLFKDFNDYFPPKCEDGRHKKLLHIAKQCCYGIYKIRIHNKKVYAIEQQKFTRG